tara:strand:- start:386 stop:643 length:258 start_codon:yes stop_codon:yes gene_type:complete
MNTIKSIIILTLIVCLFHTVYVTKQLNEIHTKRFDEYKTASSVCIDSLVTIIDKYEEIDPKYARFDTIIAEYPWGKEECYISYIK